MVLLCMCRSHATWQLCLCRISLSLGLLIGDHRKGAQCTLGVLTLASAPGPSYTASAHTGPVASSQRALAPVSCILASWSPQREEELSWATCEVHSVVDT